MSKANRRKVYEKLKAEGNLHKDDGALIKEFGEPKQMPAQLKKGKEKKLTEKKENATNN